MRSYITCRRNECYCCARVLADYQSCLGKSVTVFLKTLDLKIAHQRVPTALKLFCDHMSRTFVIECDILMQAF